MSLESELKKNTAALEANTVALYSTLPAKPAGDTEAAVIAPVPNVPVPPVAQPIAPATAAPPAPVASVPAPLAPQVSPPPMAGIQPAQNTSAPPVAIIPPAAAAPADDEARQKLVAWAQGELGKIQGVLGPQRMFEMVQVEGVEKLSLISSGRLPQFVVDAQNEAAAIQSAIPGVPQ